MVINVQNTSSTSQAIQARTVLSSRWSFDI
jgi:hypothetical protein